MKIALSISFVRTPGRTIAIKKIQERQIKTRFKLLNMIKAAK